MISADIEKEIQQPNKVVLGLTLRQSISVLASLIIPVLLFIIFQSFMILFYSVVIFAPLAVLFGWFHRDGLPAERYLLKLLKACIYKNNKRAYRTKNRYVVLMNSEYRRHQRKDMADKSIAKTVKKENKENQKRVRTSSLKAIQ